MRRLEQKPRSYLTGASLVLLLVIAPPGCGSDDSAGGMLDPDGGVGDGLDSGPADAESRDGRDADPGRPLDGGIGRDGGREDKLDAETPDAGEAPDAEPEPCAAGYERLGGTCVDVDECAMGIDDCSESAACTNTDGDFTCDCKRGYTGDGVTCADVDECLEQEDDCSEHAVCTNTDGRFTCDCDDGYVGDGKTCFEGVACDPAQPGAACDALADCVAANGGVYLCECESGYVGDGSFCDDIDECAQHTDDCADDALCTNSEGSFTCACHPGFTGDGLTCTDIQECQEGTHDCDASRATCVNTTGSFDCSCLPAYEGEDCTACAAGYQDHDGDGVCTPDCAAAALDCGAHGACDDASGTAACMYERQVLIDNPGPALTDFQVRLVFDSAPAIAEGHLLGTCAGLRFFEADGVIPVPYWLEGGCGGPAAVWLRVAHLAAASTHTLVMRYSRDDESQSDGAAVFDVFDDFSSDSAASYTLHSHASWSGKFLWDAPASRLMTDTNNADMFLTRNDSAAFVEGHWVEIRSQAGDNDGMGAVLRTGGGQFYACAVTDDYNGSSSKGANERLVRYDALPSAASQATSLLDFGQVVSARHVWAVTGLAYSHGHLRCSYDGVVQASSHDAGTLAGASLGLASLANNPAVQYDWLRIRKFASTPPAAVVDECAIDNGGCSPAATCFNAPGQVTCQCPQGHETGDGGQTCVDIDECALGVCDALTTCTNSEGAFECGACPAGYTGTGAAGCQDIDECAQNNGGCGADAACINTAGSFACGYTVGGTITGLSGGGLQLSLNGASPTAVSEGSFTFAEPVPRGESYSVQASAQPTNPWQTCAVSHGTGTIGSAHVTNVSVDCTTNTYQVRANVSGLSPGDNVALRLTINGTEHIESILSSGLHPLAARASGSSYALSVLTPGEDILCTVANGSGTLTDQEVTASVSCVPTRTVGGTVHGLAGGGTLVLANDIGDTLNITSDGTYTMPTKVADGGPYRVTVQSQPASRYCSLPTGVGIAAADVTTADVYCTGVAPDSCNAWHTLYPGAPSGSYGIDPDGAGGADPFDVFCEMIRDGGGWTLALKANGDTSTFSYASSYWTNTTLLNTGSTDLSDTEAKFASFTSMPFTQIRIGMQRDGVTNYVTGDHSASSLRSVFTGQNNQPLAISKAHWMSLIPGSALQANCNASAFNTIGQYVKVRIGIVSNNENQCGFADSYIGLGGEATESCDGFVTNSSVSTGNRACWNPFLADGTSASSRVLRAWGYLFVR